jgi:hypothetical protein
MVRPGQPTPYLLERGETDMGEITIREYANAELLAVGDMIAIYAGNSTPSHVSTVTDRKRLAGTVVITTDQGTFDLANDDRVSVVAWAPFKRG